MKRMLLRKLMVWVAPLVLGYIAKKIDGRINRPKVKAGN